ncbi:MAG TPA: hypothetical protein VLD66_10060 [Methyloceanibacter sp.]|nr:hypothetical protein [Methyloceanibacter sp.]
MAGESIWRRPAPTSLKLIAGAVIFPLLWLGIGLIAGELLKGYVGSPIPPWLLIVAALAGALASFLLARKASLPVAVILIALPMLAYVASYFAVERVGTAQEPFGTADQAAPPVEPEARPAPSAPSGAGQTYGGGHYLPEAPPEPPQSAPQYQIPAPTEQEGSPAPPAAANGGTLGARDEDSLRAQWERAAEAAAQQAMEAEKKRLAEQEAAAKGLQQPSPGPQPQTAQLPEFPWPPPQASASYVLPDKLLASYHTVGDVVDAIIGALEHGGYVERSFFQTKAGGVALVTRLERINDDGTPSAEAERWPNTGQRYSSSDSLMQFLEGLFYVDPGHYRVIVFVLQDMPFSQSATNITADEARAWLTSGANVLPSDIAARPFGGVNGGHCTALIYEFASDGTKVHVVESRLTGREHLEKAGLLAALGTTH